MITKKTYIPGKPRNKKLTNATSGSASVGKTEFNQVAGESHTHPNKGVLDQITEAMLVSALRDMILSTDLETELSDENYLSSLRTIKEITERSISKITEDEAQEVITFLKGIIANGTSHFVNLIATGKITSVDIEAENVEVTDTLTAKDIISDTLRTNILYSLVRAELQDAILKGQLNSETFTSGFLGSGFRLNRIGENWVLELDEIIVRKSMQVYELIVQRIKYQGGQVLHSPAGGKITSVVNGGTYWRVEHDSPDSFTTGAQVLCQNFKVGSESQNPDGSTTFDGVSVKRYWRLVTSYGKGWFNLSKTDMEAGSAEPEVGDDIAVLGHRTDPNQQNAIMIVSTGANSPYIAHYAGINSYSTEGKEVVREGNLSGIVDADFGQISGYGLYGQNVFLKGIFRLLSGKTVETAISDAENEAKGYADARVNNLQIGDVNLARYSGTGYYLSSAGTLLGIYSEDRSKSSVVTENGISAIRVQGGGVLRIAVVTGLTVGKTYTWRIMIKGTTDLTGSWRHWNGNNYGSQSLTITAEWAVYTKTFVCQGTYDILHIDSISDTFFVADWMLVEGNKVTEGWSPSRLDVEANINRVETETKTRFEINETNIQANVSAITSVQNNVTDLTTRVSSAESQLTIQAGQIASKVSMTEYNANNVAINQSISTVDQKADSISLKVDNLQINPRNYLRNSRTNNLTGWSSVNGTPTLVTDPKFGDVVQWQRISGSSDYQKQFTVVEKNSLANTDLVYFVLAKRVSPTGSFRYGGWPDTSSTLTSDNGNQIDYGNGWTLYWRTFKSGSTIGGAFGINTTTGTWQFCYCGISLGNKFGGWQLAQEDLPSKLLATGIDIEVGKITLTANNTIFQNNQGQQVALFNSTWTKIQASAIELEGLVTVNSKFKVLLDGSIEAVDGKFTGTVSSSSSGNRISISTVANGGNLTMVNASNRVVVSLAYQSSGNNSYGQLMQTYWDSGGFSTHWSILDPLGLSFNTTDAGYTNIGAGTLTVSTGSGSSAPKIEINDYGSGYFDMRMTGSLISGLSVRSRRITSGTTLNGQDCLITLNSGSSSFTIYLPTSNRTLGRVIIIYKVGGTANYTVHGNGATIFMGTNIGPSFVYGTQSGAHDAYNSIFIWDGYGWVRGAV